MALNDLYFFTVGYTSADEASLKKNYPIKQLYRQTQNTVTPLFPESYSLEFDTKFWFPFGSITVSDTDYIEYEDGDEFTFDQPDNVRYIPTSDPSVLTFKYQDYPGGTRLIYANQMFEATNYFFNWGDTGFGVDDNPYKTDRLRRWKIYDAGDEWTPFWYHPRQQRFYPLPQAVNDSGLIESGRALTTRWDLFTGDNENIDLSSFSREKFAELSSLGFSDVAARSIVTTEEKTVLDSLYGGQQVSQVQVFGSRPNGVVSANSTLPDDGYSRAGTTAVVALSSGGAEGETGSAGSDKPQMIQYYKNPDGTAASAPARFIFDYRPNSVNYSNIGAEWTEIPRVNNSPILDFKNFKLMKISFEFLVGDNNNIFTSCDEKLRQLREMAIRPFPVRFSGFDAMFSDQLVYPTFSTDGAPFEFAIVDMSITSIQRARAGASPGSGSPDVPTGEINRATVSITLQEVPLGSNTLIQLPMLTPDQGKPTKKKVDTDTCYRRFLSTEAIQNIGISYDQFKVDGGCGLLTDKATGNLGDYIRSLVDQGAIS